MLNDKKPPRYESVLNFWFGAGSARAIAESQSKLWWSGEPAFDAVIREQFSGLRQQAVDGELEAWLETSRGRLALIILVDQFSRSLFRGQAEAFSFDYLAQEWCLSGLDEGADDELEPIQRVFFYLPLEHSESRVDQVRSVQCFERLQRSAAPADRDLFAVYLDFARQHQAVIDRFGRFPGRNAALHRVSTAEEVAFLASDEARF